MPIKRYKYTVTHSDYKKVEGVIKEEDFKNGKAEVNVR